MKPGPSRLGSGRHERLRIRPQIVTPRSVERRLAAGGMQEFQRTDFGDYVLQDRIGAGGMAEIFLATARGIEGFEKRLVIKRILPTLSDDEQFVRMFIEEAKLCVALRHPNIVQVYDLGEIDYQYFIAMEYVDGRDLLKTLAGCGRKKIGFPTDIALYIVMEVLKGLDYAHRLERPDGLPLGIIHRDVSPSNVLLSFEGEVKIGDFGIAKATTREKTATGILKGKFGYMAPEQVTGAPIDHRADVFACGIVLYELLTGHRLFAGKNDLLVLERVRDAVIDPLPRHYRPDLDKELEGLVLRALSQDAADRFQTAAELHDAIHDYVYRSRAMVGPAHLGRFMQNLFLAEPEEVARRERVRLPPVPGHEERTGDGVATFGYEATEDERGLDRERPSALSEALPVVDIGDDAPKTSGLVYISDDYDWGRSEREIDSTRSDDSRSPVTPQPLDGAGADERTVQTDVSIEVSDSNIEAIQARSDVATVPQPAQSRPDSAYIATQTPDPKGEVLAMRRARGVQDDPTDFDLQDEPDFASAVGTPSVQPVERASRGGSIATELHDEYYEDEDATRTGDADAVEPAEIVERTRVTPVEPPAASSDQADVEPTVQFDSTIYPALRDEDVEAFGAAAPETTLAGPSPAPDTPPDPAPQVHFVDGVEDEYPRGSEDSEFGTVEVEQSDLPTAEVHESELEPLTRTPEEGTQVGHAPTRPTSVPTGLEAPLSGVDEDDDTLLRDDQNGELAAIIARHASKVLPTEAMSEGFVEEPEDEASRTDLYNPVEEGMVAELASRAPVRRRPITGHRSRPVLLPAEGEAAPLDGRAKAHPVYGRRRSSPRRRVATRVPLSVVNPAPRDVSRTENELPAVDVREEPEDRAVSTIPAPVVTADRDASAAARAHTGAGSLVDVEAHPGPTPDQPMGRRRSSGVTAALSEAAMIDEEIAELRKSSVTPRDDTTAGQLASDDPQPAVVDDDFEATQDGHGSDLRSAIMRRQSRRRMVTRSFVLYGDEKGKKPREDSASFGEDSEMSVPAITDAGQLEDEGASDLFGVLSVLDEDQPDFGFEADEEMSLETDARYYGDLDESVSEVRTSTPPPRVSSEQAQAVEFGHTSLGSLTPDDTDNQPVVFNERGRQPDYGAHEETTASVTDGQVVSVSQLIRGELPSPHAEDMTPANLAGIELEFTDDGPFEEVGFSGAIDPSARGELIDNHHAPDHFHESEEPTQEQPRNQPTGPNPVAFGPPSEDPNLTSGDRPSHKGMLVSESFDFGADQQDRWRDAYREPDDGGTPDIPVRPVSMRHPPGGVEPTRSQLAEDLPGLPVRRDNQNVLRAVVERQRVARELNRAQKKRVPPPTTPQRPRSPPRGAFVPGVATGSLAGAAATPSVGEVYPPAAHVEVERTRAWTTASYVMVAVAVALAVAAAVSSIPLGNQRGAAPKGQGKLQSGLVKIPDEPLAPLPERPTEPKNIGAPLPADDPGTAAADAGITTEPSGSKEAGLAEPARSAEPTQKAAPTKTTPPAPKRATKAPARTKKRPVKRASPRKRTRRVSKKVDKSLATLRFKCSEPLDIRISTVGTTKNQTRFTKSLSPGWYRVKLYRNGDKVSQMDVELLAGQSVSIPCP